ncbi:MAG: FAD-binding oxidoreductase [Chitinophagaceae bacterium]|nr:FAD-binding oxidoreductase [Chitinophagaceae bacterium]
MNIQEALLQILPAEKVKTRITDRYSYASDASFYYLIPKAVVQPSSIEEIKALFSFSQTQNIPIVFRTGGTSLSGQSITDGILIDLSRHWQNATVLDQGNAVKVQPGIIGGQVNQLLKKYGRKIGPDPASINAAMMGGILSNNSSGMCCGVVDNAYHTLQSMAFMLPDGSYFDTSIQTDYTRFEKEQIKLCGEIRALQKRLLNNDALVAKIRKKYELKNTVGYALNAFIDYEHPLDILSHLLIGAEGTLAFISEAVLKTLPDMAFKATTILYFETALIACNAIAALKASGAAALELMDRAALRSIENHPSAPEAIKDLSATTTAILCEYQAVTAEELAEQLDMASAMLESLPTVLPYHFTTDSEQQTKYWKLRKGMYPSVAAAREKGSTVLLEDIAFPIEVLGAAVIDVQALMLQYGFENGIIFGHAKEGNLHFVIAHSFNEPKDIIAYENFAKELAVLVLEKYNGSLKAEHGTGRQIAPFIADEWGIEAYEMMKALKTLVDPHNLLNPGVIINADKDCHIKNLKTLPIIEAEVDKCIECGYCEHRCPSKEFTLTPRKRIVVRRALQRLAKEKDTITYNQLLKEYQFDGLDTCAVDGLCALECPVDINTGDLVKRLRRENHTRIANTIALTVAKHFGALELLVKMALRAGGFTNRLLGKQTMHHITKTIRKIVPAFPIWTNELTGPIKFAVSGSEQASAVFFNSCISRMMGADKESNESTVDIALRVAKKTGIELLVPEGLSGTCCGQAFSSKGFQEAYQFTANQTIEKLWSWTKEGRLPIIMDTTSCTHSLLGSRPYLNKINQQRFDKMQILDIIDFYADTVIPNLTITNQKNKIIFHPVCSTYKMNLLGKLKKIGVACSKEVHFPLTAGCCGMAGDRGFYYPELTAAATRAEALEVNQTIYDGYYSTGKTCEMSVSASVSANYRSILYLMDEVSS